MTAAPTAVQDPRPFKAARSGLPSMALAAFLIWPAAGRTEASVASASGKASASIHFRIVVPPAMRILENSHPAQLQPTTDGLEFTAEQKIVVVSNLKHGFCVALRQTSPERAAGWRVDWQMLASHQSQMNPTEEHHEESAPLTPLASGGYRLCTGRPGQFTLRLQHAFSAQTFAGAPSTTANPSLYWPVQTELTAL